MIPALLIRMSIFSRLFPSCSAHSLTLARLDRSSLCTTTFPSVAFLISSAASSAFSMFLHNITTLAPLLLSSMAVTFPIPVLAPVITTVFPSSLAVELTLGPCIHSLNRKSRRATTRAQPRIPKMTAAARAPPCSGAHLGSLHPQPEQEEQESHHQGTAKDPEDDSSSESSTLGPCIHSLKRKSRRATTRAQ